ncbi:uncharacterized protein LOC110931756 [Helianthus annuus]|uniref:uncharacterized protein LOC110931756 n=1 Tax=Helianthus annuus TaxID=4232 RepID=UPI000B8F4050|nr:uncharacterized protein LOC110931756 [Helianthus annuus]
MEWCNWIPAKVNIHMWRSEMDRIPTAEALKKRNVQWLPDPKGEFSVKAVKKLLFEEAGQGIIFTMEWCNWIPAKVDFHMWRSEMDRIPTAEALKKRNVQVSDSSCMLCNSAEETTEHIFIACQAATIVWNGISTWCKIPNIFAFSIKDLLGIHKEIRGSEKKKDAIQGIKSIVCWSLWRARNNAKFSNIPVRIENILSEVKALGFLYFSSRSKHKG